MTPGPVLALERALPQTLADQVAARGCSVEEAIEIAGGLARRLAVHPLPSIRPLTDTMSAWEDQLDKQIAAHPAALPARALDRARDTIRHLVADGTSTMLHGDLHYGNILRSHRAPWLTIDPKGWFGTAAFDAFTVAAGGREQLSIDNGLHATIKRRVRQFAAVARVNPT
jgi:streptomycin 6-kinase